MLRYPAVVISTVYRNSMFEISKLWLVHRCDMLGFVMRRIRRGFKKISFPQVLSYYSAKILSQIR